MNRTAIIYASIATLGLLAGAALLMAGPLDPPAGPVAPAYKTLTEVEPRIAINATNTPGDTDSLFKITQPGSYYLTGNITGEAGKHGIKITTGGVTVDLMGFDLVGIPGMGAFDGVHVPPTGLTDISIRNGSVRRWGSEGIEMALSNNAAIFGIRASGNGGMGIRVGSSSAVSQCVAFDNALIGIVINHGSTISHCTSYQNEGSGFFTGSGTTMSECAAYENALTGVSAGAGSSISRCTAHANGDDGFSLGAGATIMECTSRNNAGNGIQVSSGSLVLGNTCATNGFSTGDGAGIHVTSVDNRIEGNVCTSADRGIDVDSAGNFISRNTCSGNTNNWDVVAGNICLVVNAVASGAILGNSGGVSAGSADPNANFTY